jgi:hypothetical protein
MAKFVKDEAVSGQTPNYMGYAKKIDVPNFPQNDQWKGLAGMLETVGTLATGFQKTYEDQLNQKIGETADKLQMDEVARLEQNLGVNSNIPKDVQTEDPNHPVNTDPVNARVWGPTGGTGAENPEIVPEGKLAENIDKGLARIERLQGAADQGKAPTHYSAQAMAEWRKLRATVPAKYKEHVDKKFASAMGFDPANKYMADLNAQAKALTDQKNNEKTKVLSYLDDLKTQDPGAASAYSKVLSGEWTAQQGMAYAEKAFKPIIAANESKRQWDSIKQNDDIAKWTADKQINEYIAAKKTNLSNGAVSNMGLDNPEVIRQKIAEVRSGKNKDVTQAQLTQWGQALAVHAQNFRTELNARYDLANPAGLSPRAILSSEDLNKKTDAAVKEYDDLAKSLLGGNYEMALFTVKNMQDKTTDLGKALFESDTQLGDMIRKGAILDAASGKDSEFSKLMLTAMIGQSGATATMQNYVSQKTIAGGMQLQIPAADGKPITVNGAIEHMYRAGAPVPTGSAMAIEQLNQFSNPDLPKDYKQGLVMYYFHKENMGLLSKFNKEQRGHIFNRMTSPGVIDEVWKATEDRPDLRNQVTDWARHSFGVEFMTTEIKDLNGVTMPQGVNVAFDPETSHLKVMHQGIDVTNSSLLPGTARPAFRPSRDGEGPVSSMEAFTPGLQAVKNPVMRINQAIDNVKYIAKKTGEDHNVWLVDALRTAGLNVDFNRITADPALVTPPKKGTK